MEQIIAVKEAEKQVTKFRDTANKITVTLEIYGNLLIQDYFRSIAHNSQLEI